MCKCLKILHQLKDIVNHNFPPLRGLQLVCNKVLLLLSGKRISKGSGVLTSIFFGKVFCEFLKTQTMLSHVVFSIEFAMKYGGFILFLVRRRNNLLFWVFLLYLPLFRRSGLFLILLFLTTEILCRLHSFSLVVGRAFNLVVVESLGFPGALGIMS